MRPSSFAISSSSDSSASIWLGVLSVLAGCGGATGGAPAGTTTVASAGEATGGGAAAGVVTGRGRKNEGGVVGVLGAARPTGTGVLDAGPAPPPSAGDPSGGAPAGLAPKDGGGGMGRRGGNGRKGGRVGAAGETAGAGDGPGETGGAEAGAGGTETCSRAATGSSGTSLGSAGMAGGGLAGAGPDGDQVTGATATGATVGSLSRERGISRASARTICEFDQHVVGSADHHEMFDIIAAHENQLALPVEIEGIDDAEARLTGSPAARHMQPAAECQTENEQNQESRDKKCNGAR